MWVGAALFGLGVLAVAFVSYQLWGTALYEEQAQSHLTSELAHQLHRPLPTSADGLASSASRGREGLPHLATQTVPLVAAPAINQPVGLLSIPKIGILDTIVEGVDEEQLEQGPGHYPGTPLPGEAGNVAIAGHRVTYAHPFYNLNALAPGDNVYILTKQGFFRYTVTGSQVVDPSDLAVLDAAPGQSTLTLTTCNPRYSASTRLVVTADFDGRTASVSAASSSRSAAVRRPAGEGDGLGAGGGPVLPALVWGVVSLGLGVCSVILFGRVRHWWRLAVLLVAIPAVGLSLLVCFEHISLALPGSY